jgi:AcrR family transcriptional regulator
MPKPAPDNAAPARTTRSDEILGAAATLFAASGVRTSLKDIAEACGILPGSMYYYFDSKEALIAELVRRYEADLGQTASQAAQSLQRREPGPLVERVLGFGRDIASCASRHLAVLMMTLFEPPTGANGDLLRQTRATLARVQATMAALLQSVGGDAAIRPEVDPALLAERLCESMIRHTVAVADYQLGPESRDLPDLRCRILLDGLALAPTDTAALDRSAAFVAVGDAIASWRPCEGSNERMTRLLVGARSEFARHGYEVATLRQIAAAAGFNAGSVYQLFQSKRAMLDMIMASFTQQRRDAWKVIVNSLSSPLEKLDALLWLHIMLNEKFGEEIRIQFGIVREAPLGTRRDENAALLREIARLLMEGIACGELRAPPVSLDMYARCVNEALWTPESLLRKIGPQQAHALARNTVLSGALK